ncbi:hypothetical protein SDRG_11474 [Saprolegnia diclina VS20]|uniref:Uncharacterized protein n=1 Tax=Saprolegnia diclina (strain VS20) TaxID=1156394 RepID=T0QB07_SAPDV|nr:hypothetical protein SDRG_11474 [Saprolegnia diclina VS20]EQC30715.1 hypothetical protein SDRG_11474 [Saprolegnia diclina VS20]|eukprot:XP_008615739.1 hypothetical protein SDRG_11474 [Saprolegnia diclina VS20]
MEAKFNSLAGRWYKKAPKLVETPTTSAMLKRNVIVATAKGRYRLLSVYVKSYNKWRIETSPSATKSTMIHACGVEWDIFQHVLKSNNDYVSFRSDEVKAVFKTV